MSAHLSMTYGTDYLLLVAIMIIAMRLQWKRHLLLYLISTDLSFIQFCVRLDLEITVGKINACNQSN